MQLSSMPSRQYLPNSIAQRQLGGLGDIFSDLITGVMTYSSNNAATSIANSQAIQQQAAAQTAQAQAAAAIAASNKNTFGLSTPVMLAIAGGLGLLLVMRKRK